MVSLSWETVRATRPFPILILQVLLLCQVIAAADGDTSAAKREQAKPKIRRDTIESGADWTEPQKGERHFRAIKVDEPPVVDGRLNDRAWELADDPGPLFQTQPDAGAPATEPTTFRMVYDSDAIYIAIWCFDAEPQKIIGREMARDGSIFQDDWVIIVVDTFFDQRNGYYLAFNPVAARYDALITNNTGFNESWNAIWTVRTSIDDEGWKAEIMVPLKSISFNPATDTWGFNVVRNVKRKNERTRWSNYEVRVNNYDFVEAGTVSGLNGLHQGLGLDIKPYALSRFNHDRVKEDDDLTFDFGGDIRYRITPNLTTSLSYNTDFAETEVDARQINLTRFPLFFPEKRGFFLEDSGIFDFGGLSSSQFLPFFSRRVGLSEQGEVVPILAAAKLTGRVNSYNVGIMDAVLEDHDGLGERNALVTRVSKNVFDQSTVGMITTFGDPNTRNDNVVSGLDFGLKTNELFGDQILQVDGYGIGSYTEGEQFEDNYSYGLSVSYPNEPYIASARAYQIDEGFDAALGFVPRTAIRAYNSSLSFRPRPKSLDAVRRLLFSYSTTHFTDLSNRLETARHGVIPFWVQFDSGDEIWFQVEREFDGPLEDFEISEGVTIPADDYWWTHATIGVDSATKRLVSITPTYSFGEFYDGNREVYNLSTTLTLIPRVITQLSYTLNQVRLPAGDFNTRLASLRLQFNFTPDLVWNNFVQFDSVSDSIGLNSRVRWGIHPGTDLFVVVNQNTNRGSGRIRFLETELTVKLGVTLRF